MHIGIAYAEPHHPVWIDLEIHEGSTVEDAIRRSGILARFPDIDLKTQKVGIFGKFTRLDAGLQDGDRVEIYRPIVADPAKVPRRNSSEAAD